MTPFTAPTEKLPTTLEQLTELFVKWLPFLSSADPDNVKLAVLQLENYVEFAARKIADFLEYAETLSYEGYQAKITFRDEFIYPETRRFIFWYDYESIDLKTGRHIAFTSFMPPHKRLSNKPLPKKYLYWKDGNFHPPRTN